MWYYQLRRIGLPKTHPQVQDVMILNKPVTVFGRWKEKVDYILDSLLHQQLISRRHATIKRTSDDGVLNFTLIDTSLNGTYINDIRIRGRCILTEGDTITFGHLNGVNIKPGERVLQEKSEFKFVFEKIPIDQPCRKSALPHDSSMPGLLRMFPYEESAVVAKVSSPDNKSAVLPSALNYNSFNNSKKAKINLWPHPVTKAPLQQAEKNQMRSSQKTLSPTPKTVSSVVCSSSSLKDKTWHRPGSSSDIQGETDQEIKLMSNDAKDKKSDNCDSLEVQKTGAAVLPSITPPSFSLDANASSWNLSSVYNANNYNLPSGNKKNESDSTLFKTDEFNKQVKDETDPDILGSNVLKVEKSESDNFKYDFGLALNMKKTSSAVLPSSSNSLFNSIASTVASPALNRKSLDWNLNSVYNTNSFSSGTKSYGNTNSLPNKRQGHNKRGGRGTGQRKKSRGRPRNVEVHQDDEPCAFLECKRPHSDMLAWVQCDDCLKWFHLDCVGCNYSEVSGTDKSFQCGCL